MSRNNKLEFVDANEALAELNAVDRGRYFLCTCPECKENEAFMYKNNLNFIQCNRENECGERTMILYKEKTHEVDPRFKKLMNSYPELNEQQVEALDWFNRALKHLADSGSPTLDEHYRGLSPEVSKQYISDFRKEELVGFMFEKIKPLLQKDYSNNGWMKKRNLVIPVHGDNGNVERILLRSSIQPDIEPKEIQLVVNPSKDTRDFFVDVNSDSETVVITEAIFDGMSFKEVDRDIGFIALTGSSKTRKVSEYLQENIEKFRSKNILFALDDDKAGIQAMQRLMSVVEKEQIGKSVGVFQYPKKFNYGISDPNDYLNINRTDFKESVEKSLNDFKKSRVICNESKVGAER